MESSSELDALLVRLYFDRHITVLLAHEFRSVGFDVLTTEEAGMDSANDSDQLSFATQEQRAILTFNIRDFAPLHEQWLAAGRNHAGIIVSQQFGRRQYGTLFALMSRFLNHFSRDDLRNNFVHLGMFR